MLLVEQIRIPLQQQPEDAMDYASKLLKLQRSDIVAAGLHKLSVDARHGRPAFVCSVAFRLAQPAQEAALAAGGRARLVDETLPAFQPGSAPLPGPVVVCGLGPAGLFAALELAEAGFCPLVLERGPMLSRRLEAVRAFEREGRLNPEANIQFGEGGAGTFSDGKLVSRISNPLAALAKRRLLAAGAPPEIAWQAKPHIGTDRLRPLLVALRKQLEARGGRVLFNTRLTGIVSKNGRLASLKTTAGPFPCGALVLAVGHSARDTFSLLAQQGLTLVPKPFSVGLRIEHLQSDIDRALYHEAAGHPALPPGEYQLAARAAGRGVYTFCMCPGGSVVAAASEEKGVVTNGMSLHARGGPNANSALVANVDAADFGPNPLAAVAWQRGLEQAAFAAGGGSYAAPAQTLGSFLAAEARLDSGRVQPSYPLGVRCANLGALLPPGVAEALRGGILAFDKKLRGFGSADALLTGLETRTSSPLRIPRGDDMQNRQLPGLWPCGEGAGFAGGILSAAVDGIRVARALAACYVPPGQ